jgi:membrane protein DedA with SNARE-associated domain
LIASLAVAPYIQTYGYWAVLLGALLEGETVLIIAGYSVSRGYLNFFPVVLLAAAGGIVGDFIYFSIGRRYGPGIIRRFPALRRVRSRAILIMRRWGRFTAFMTRFAYGLRVVLPMTMGASKMRPSVFLLFNAAGAFTFALFYVSLGFVFGEVMEEMLGRVRPYERWILLGVVATGALAWGIRKWLLYRASEADTLAAAEALRREREAAREQAGRDQGPGSRASEHPHPGREP